jgi:hypothetical protein
MSFISILIFRPTVNVLTADAQLVSYVTLKVVHPALESAKVSQTFSTLFGIFEVEWKQLYVIT